MIKVFSLNKDNKIELTKEQLESLLNEAYGEGYWKGRYIDIYTYTTPDYHFTNTPYNYNISTSIGGSIKNEI